MININNIPLVHQEDEDAKNFLNPDNFMSGYYLVKPIWTYLPDFDEMDDAEKKKYKLRSIKEGLYLTGLELISDKWVNKGFCASIFSTFGIILDEAYPVEMKSEHYKTEKSMVFLRFEHILFDARGNGNDEEIHYTVC